MANERIYSGIPRPQYTPDHIDSLKEDEGKKYKTLNASTIGEVLTVSGDTFTSRNGSWIYTWDRDGKKINTRTAR